MSKAKVRIYMNMTNMNQLAPFVNEVVVLNGDDKDINPMIEGYLLALAHNAKAIEGRCFK